MAEIASMATARGVMLPARLRIDQRRRKIPGQPTRDYIVPVLELPETNFAQLVASGHIATTDPQLAPRPPMGAAPALPATAGFERASSPGFGSAPAATGPGGWALDDERATSAPAAPTTTAVAAPPATTTCGDEDASPMALGLCAKPNGHSGPHGNAEGTWPR
jgi:hypothetical protein